MQGTRLRALKLTSWVLWGLALLGLGEDLGRLAFGAAGGLPHLVEAMGFIACGNALVHVRALLEQRPNALAESRDAPANAQR